MPVQTLDICNIKGLHARASARFAEVVESYPKADATVRKDGMDTGGDSIMGLLMLGAGVGSVIDYRVLHRQDHHSAPCAPV